MAEALKQDEADALIQAALAGNDDLASDTKAVDQATQTATDIAGEIQSVQNPPGIPAEPAPEVSAAPESLPDIPADSSPPAPATLPPFPTTPTPPPGPVYSPEIQRLMAIEVPIIVQLGVRRMNVGEVMHFAVGAIIEFSKSAEEELELLANNKDIGKGYAVKVGENFGIKLTHIGPVKETIRKLGIA